VSDGSMAVVLVIVAWVAVGAITGLVEARHGHWSKSWVLGAVLGPFAVPLAIHTHRREPRVTRTLAVGDAGAGSVDVLVGVDGSAASMAAAAKAAAWFGTQLGRLTLAAVLDLDTAAPHADSVLQPEAWAEETSAEDALQAARRVVRETAAIEPASVVLAGRPADVLEAYAADHGFDVIVVGSRGRGFSKALLGSCASRLAGRTHVPVLLVPASAAAPSAPSPGIDAVQRW
jgi:nucleotide-binding universal stress UspA family protein